MRMACAKMATHNMLPFYLLTGLPLSGCCPEDVLRWLDAGMDETALAAAYAQVSNHAGTCSKTAGATHGSHTPMNVGRRRKTPFSSASLTCFHKKTPPARSTLCPVRGGAFWPRP